jgi:hypothetical protein
MTERRRSPRRPIHQAATILFDHRHVRRCTIRDVSEGGAGLELASMLDVPDTFDLIWDQNARTCQVVWREGNRLGVRFDPFFLSIGSN